MGAVFIGFIKRIVGGIWVKEEGSVFGEFGDEVEIVSETVSDGRSVAIAEDKMREAGDYHNDDKSRDWENAEHAGVGVFGEKAIPFFEDVFEAMGDKN